MSFKKFQQGFSLLELIVVIAIFLIITAVVMTDIPNFGRKGALDLTAQEVAGCIRATQNYGTTKKIGEDNSPVGANLEDNKVTIYFDNGNASPNFYSSDDDIIETCNLNGYSLAADGEISNIIFMSTNYQKSIKSNLEPTFYDSEGSLVDDVSLVKLIIESLRNKEKRCVFVFSSGQITVSECDYD
ncbi:MAG: type II secretion system protein [Candidatus Paceibacterota bacterium]|jgi:prepilin-type N-terminal cleavage/methylation domain-containing protein